MGCEHEPYVPIGMENIPDFCVMNLGNTKIHLCKKCNLVYWEEVE